MKKPTKQPGMLTRIIKVFYRFIFPITTIVLLLLVSGKISRPLFSGSTLLDFVARLWISIIFCMGYIIFSDIEKYKAWFYSRKIENLNSNIDVMTLFWNISMSVMLGIFATFISWWTIRTFLPIFNNIILILALLNGVIFSAPMLYHSNRFRL